MAKKQKRTSTSTQVDLFAFGNVQDSRQMTDFAEQSYLDYAMYVILDRALPRIADGLKPVQRRIIYAMSELGLSAGAKYKKSARTVGDVIGKFHPHGDSACYEAMVLMAQPFSYRYPLIDGQGNWGAQDDPKSFAAMRYTESKLMPYAQVLLAEIEKGTVDWAQNFDGTLKEPTILPARLPNILLNGGSGIAVGMATDIPPHNIHEVVNACVHLLDNPKATLTDLCEFIQGPDFPTEAEIITPQSDIFQMYVTGHGSIKQRGLWQKEGDVIAITALPYQVSGTRILEQIAAQIESKKLPMVSDIRDESDSENPTRIVIEPKSNRVDFDALMNHLFATTDLEKSHRVNLNAIGLDGRPKVFNLRMIIEEWLVYRRDTVTRRLQYRLNQVNERLHILDGLLIAFLNIDEVIRIIRTEDDAKPVLIAAFNLTDTQAESILNLRLRHLAKLEEFKIRSEQDELAKEQKKLMSILGSNAKLKKLIRDELLSDAQEYGDDRRSQLVVRGSAKAFDESELISSEAVTVVLSEKGWIRGAKGHDVNPSELSYKQGDSYLQSCQGKTNQSLIALDQTGRSYSLPAHNLPSARGFGEPLSSFFTPPAGVGFSGLVMGNEADKCLLCASNGYGFITTLAEMATKNKKGKASIKASETHPALTPIRIDNVEESLLVAVTTDGYMLAFALNELPELAKGKGNKIINIPSAKLKAGEELLLSAVVVAPNQQLVITAGKRFTRFKFNDLNEYQTERAKRGKKLPKGFQQVSGVSVE